MDDNISRQQAIDAVKNYWKSEVDALHTNPKYADFNEHTEACDSILTHNANICKALDQLPSAQPQRKNGRWKLLNNGDAICSECGRKQKCVWDFDNWDNFCRHCGADMRGEKDD